MFLFPSYSHNSNGIRFPKVNKKKLCNKIHKDPLLTPFFFFSFLFSLFSFWFVNCEHKLREAPKKTHTRMKGREGYVCLSLCVVCCVLCVRQVSSFDWDYVFLSGLVWNRPWCRWIRGLQRWILFLRCWLMWELPYRVFLTSLLLFIPFHVDQKL